MAKWYEKEVERFEVEKGLLAERGFVLDEAALRDRKRVEFTGTINDSVMDVAVRIVCPEGFPFQIPWFFVPDLHLTSETRHIALRTRQICLRFIERGAWDDDEHIVNLLGDAAKVLRGQHTGSFENEHTLPDQDLFGTQNAQNVLLFPDDLRALPAEEVISCHLRTIRQVFAITQVAGHASADPVVTRIGGTAFKIKVFRLRDVPIASLASFDNTFGDPTNDWRAILRNYAVSRDAERLAYSNVLGKETFFGVTFDFQGQTQWQFFKLTKQKGVVSAEALRTAFTSQLNARVTASFDAGLLNDARVVLVGAGAIGSTVALELSAAGVGHLDIYDNDALSLGNIIRHEGAITDVGKPKVQIVSERILVKNPRTSLTLGGDIFRAAEFEDKVAGASLVIVTVGDWNVEAFVNRVCVQNEVPLIVSFVGAHAAAGYVVRISQDGGGCFQCFNHLVDDLPQLPKLANPDEAILEIGCNNPSLPGAGFDIKTVALATVRKAIQTLLSEGQSYVDDAADILFIGSRSVPGSDFYSLETHKYPLERVVHCEVCGVERL